MKKKEFTEKQRHQIYKKALDYFIRTQKNRVYLVIGMCDAIETSNLYMNGALNMIDNNNIKNMLPEFYAFKPKTTWKENPNYWFTRIPKHGGYEKRVSILTALVNGQSAKDWKKKWKESGKR